MRLSYQDLARTGPGTIAGRFMRLFWQPVFVSEELAAGRAKPIRIMSEDFTLYRGESGTPHLLEFRCAHRGTQLSSGWVEQDDIRCRYHGWRYAGTGQCVEQPAERKPFADRVKLKSYPVQEYLGLIFAYLGEAEPPPFLRYPHFEQDGFVEALARVRRCNYWYDLDNHLDMLHVDWTHRHRLAFDEILHVSESKPWSFDAWETEWGITAQFQLADGGVRVNHFPMPNIEVFCNPSPVRGTPTITDNLSWRVPIDDTSQVSFNLRLWPPDSKAGHNEDRKHRESQRALYVPVEVWDEKILRGELSLEDLIGRNDVPVWDMAKIQDDVMQIGQGAIEHREAEHLGSSDKGVILARRIWMRELQALAEGRPLKQWRFSDAMRPDYGEKKKGGS